MLIALPFPRFVLPPWRRWLAALMADLRFKNSGGANHLTYKSGSPNHLTTTCGSDPCCCGATITVTINSCGVCGGAGTFVFTKTVANPCTYALTSTTTTCGVATLTCSGGATPNWVFRSKPSPPNILTVTWASVACPSGAGSPSGVPGCTGTAS